MKKLLILFFFLCSISYLFGQEAFKFENKVEKVVVPFKLINNLIFVPIKVNGIELNFLLDTGVEETILFSLEEKQEVNFFNVEKISLKGLGSEAPIEGLKSTNNTLEIKGLKSENHLLYIVLDPNFNLSSNVGIAVNGIIGYQFFRENLVKINYNKKRITITKNEDKFRKKIEKKSQKIPISIEKMKPYLEGKVTLETTEILTKLLIDIGNSDAIWLFENKSKGITIPTKNFEDNLGKGFSGIIEGKRGQLKRFSFANYDFKNPIVAFPDSISLQNVKMVKDRAGSIGAEILRRFELVFDYKNQQLYFKKNNHFFTTFNYNRSGLEIHQNGLQWVQETFKLQTVSVINNGGETQNSETNGSNFKYKFVLKPIFTIENIRKNSPAALSGLQTGDVVISINNKPGYEFSLEKINAIFKSEDENWISIEVERDSQILKFKFQLQNVL